MAAVRSGSHSVGRAMDGTRRTGACGLSPYALGWEPLAISQFLSDIRHQRHVGRGLAALGRMVGRSGALAAQAM